MTDQDGVEERREVEEGTDDARDEGGGADEERQGGFSGGIRHGLGVLTAFKEAMEETIQDARDRGDLSAERAREVLQETMDRMKQVAGEARGRFDFATQQEVESLRAQVEQLKARVRELTGEEPGEGEEG